VEGSAVGPSATDLQKERPPFVHWDRKTRVLKSEPWATHSWVDDKVVKRSLALVGLEFLHQGLQVHLVPTFHDLVAFHDQEGGSLQGSLLARGWKAEMVARMSHRYSPSNGYAVTFGDNILYVDVEIRERAAERSVDSLERFGTDENRIRIRKAVGLTLRVEHFVNRCFALLVPDLLKPAP